MALLPGQQRRVVHREFRSIRRISRERLQDLPQTFSIDDCFEKPGTPDDLKEIVMNNVIKTQSNMAKVMVAASFFALGCTAIGGTALAQEPASPSTTNWSVTYPVRYSDLDVSTTQGAKTLYLRIRYAAETLCESAATWGKKEGEACVNKAVNDAVARVNVPLLTQYNQLRTNGDKSGLVQLAKVN
jgi:UrcA family protein